MPLINITVSSHLDETRKDNLLKSCSRILAGTTGKPEAYTMAVIQDCRLSFAGNVVKGAFVDIRGIGGLTQDVNKRLSMAICDLLKKELQIAPEHVYMTFTDVPAANWGWKGATFG